MAGTILTVGVLVCTVSLSTGFAAVAGGAVLSQRLTGAADAAALAAADAASGAVSGVPCERAGELAAVAGAAVSSCEVAELVATVTVTAAFGHLALTASARAGPPRP
jgi:secretion/DNA translocation related TadE-like protein